jgi:hypothetical protein
MMMMDMMGHYGQIALLFVLDKYMVLDNHRYIEFQYRASIDHKILGT